MKKIPAVFCLALGLFGVPVFFIQSGLLSRVLVQATGLRVDPGFTGGEPAARIYDDLGDDTGEGNLSYPSYRGFVPGSLDLVRYTVYEPVYHAQWVEPREYWQLELHFADGEAAVRTVMIYLDMDGDGRGRLDTLDASAEEIGFDPLHPWDWAIRLAGGEGALFIPAAGRQDTERQSFPSGEPEGDFETVRLRVFNEGRTTKIRIPLETRQTHLAYAAEKTWHYVLVGGYDGLGRGMFTTVERRRTNRSGGGASSPLVPKIYDMITPDSLNQAALLAGWNGETLERALVYPVEIAMKGADRSFASQGLGEAASLKARMAAAAEKSRAEGAAAWAAMDEAAPLWTRGETAFRAGDHGQAERLFAEILAAEPDNPKALAYMGSLIALKASGAPALAAVDLVTRAFRDLDRAVELAGDEEEKLAAYMNRGNVSLSVPNTVFNKALSGAEDFLKAAEIYRFRGNAPSAAAAYYNAFRCFAAAGNDEEGGTWLREAARLAAEE
ncbi:MAG: hypothetical protein LBQ61_01685 [Spirochaetales bacterium]|jgi:hypothetical protein|nr:hypothetical protein [Spirochaetales bacterium]